MYVYEATGNTVMYIVMHLMRYNIPISKNTLRATINLQETKKTPFKSAREKGNKLRWRGRRGEGVKAYNLPVLVKKNNNNASIYRDHY